MLENYEDYKQFLESIFDVWGVYLIIYLYGMFE